MFCNQFRFGSTRVLKGMAAVLAAAALCAAAGEASARSAVPGVLETPLHAATHALLAGALRGDGASTAANQMATGGMIRQNLKLMDGDSDNNGGHADDDHGDHGDKGDKGDHGHADSDHGDNHSGHADNDHGDHEKKGDKGDDKGDDNGDQN